MADFIKSEGVSAESFESERIGTLTEESEDNATVNLSNIERSFWLNILPIFGKVIVPVRTGYFGRTPFDKISLLGRIGSDYFQGSKNY